MPAQGLLRLRERGVLGSLQAHYLKKLPRKGTTAVTADGGTVLGLDGTLVAFLAYGMALSMVALVVLLEMFCSFKIHHKTL